MLNLILLLALVLAVVIWFWVKWYKVRNVGKRGGYGQGIFAGDTVSSEL